MTRFHSHWANAGGDAATAPANVVAAITPPPLTSATPPGVVTADPPPPVRCVCRGVNNTRCINTALVGPIGPYMWCAECRPAEIAPDKCGCLCGGCEVQDYGTDACDSTATPTPPGSSCPPLQLLPQLALPLPCLDCDPEHSVDPLVSLPDDVDGLDADGSGAFITFAPALPSCSRIVWAGQARSSAGRLWAVVHGVAPACTHVRAARRGTSCVHAFRRSHCSVVARMRSRLEPP